MEKDEILDLKTLKEYLKSGSNKEQQKSTLIAQKKSIVKEKDCMTPFSVTLFDKEGHVIKANNALIGTPDQLKVKVVINTTNIMDVCCDVHYPGL